MFLFAFASQADQQPAEQEVVSGKEKGLSTFGGVFTPSMLTILGVIMYPALRLGSGQRRDGSERLVDAYGLGAMVPNTILLGDSEELAHRHRYCKMVRHFHEAKRNVLILRNPEDIALGEMLLREEGMPDDV
jgi:hypothetical protein